MKKEYDFSKGVRGKFYNPKGDLNIPIYLEPEVADFVKKLSIEKKNRSEQNSQQTVEERHGNNTTLMRRVYSKYLMKYFLILISVLIFSTSVFGQARQITAEEYAFDG